MIKQAAFAAAMLALGMSASIRTNNIAIPRIG